MNFIKWIFGFLAAFCLFVIIILSSVELVVFNQTFYSKQYDKNNAVQVLMADKPSLMKVTAHMLDYLRGKEESLNITININGEKRPFFDQREISHMEDVRNLFLIAYKFREIIVVTFFICIVLLALLKYNWKYVTLKSIELFFIIAFLALSAFGLLVSTDFNKYFTIFHELFFKNDLWLLDPATDLLINLLPEPFFISISIYIVVIAVVLIILTIGLSRYLASKSKFKN